jgi:hypothetical protein
MPDPTRPATSGWYPEEIEFPLTERRRILDNRITADLLLRY